MGYLQWSTRFFYHDNFFHYFVMYALSSSQWSLFESVSGLVFLLLPIYRLVHPENWFFVNKKYFYYIELPEKYFTEIWKQNYLFGHPSRSSSCYPVRLRIKRYCICNCDFVLAEKSVKHPDNYFFLIKIVDYRIKVSPRYCITFANKITDFHLFHADVSLCTDTYNIGTEAREPEHTCKDKLSSF